MSLQKPIKIIEATHLVCDVFVFLNALLINFARRLITHAKWVVNHNKCWTARTTNIVKTMREIITVKEASRTLPIY